MDLVEIKNIKTKLEELEERVKNKGELTVNEIKEWVADCVAIFSLLGISSDIVRGFMNIFEYVGMGSIPKERIEELNYWISSSRRLGRIKEFFYVNIAFKTARKILEKQGSEEKLVPNHLINFLKENNEYSHLVDSLKSMQSSYGAKDIDSLLDSTTSLLESILNLDDDLLNIVIKGNRIKSIKAKLDKLRGDNKRIEYFGCDEELIGIFYRFRYFRNHKSMHKKIGSSKIKDPKYPISTAYSFACLVIYFLHRAIVQEKYVIIK